MTSRGGGSKISRGGGSKIRATAIAAPCVVCNVL